MVGPNRTPWHPRVRSNTRMTATAEGPDAVLTRRGPSSPSHLTVGAVPRYSHISLTSTNSTRRNDLANSCPASDNQPPSVATRWLHISNRGISIWILGEVPMRRLDHSIRLHRTVVVSRWIAAVAIPVLSASLAADPGLSEVTFPPLAWVAAWADNWAWLGILVCSGVTGGCALAQQTLGDPKVHAVVGEVLNRFRDGVFGDGAGDYAHHRVTLFRHYGFHLRGFDFKDRGWPGSGWLVPVARSGHTAQKTSVRFLAPDDTDRARGIAGRAWAASNGTASATGLPDVRSDVSTDDIQQYARRTNVAKRWVMKRLPQARSLMGFTIETPNGKPWGVLVVDSRSPDLDFAQAKIQYHNHGSVLGHLVEGR